MDNELEKKINEMRELWNDKAEESLALALEALHKVEALEARIIAFNARSQHKI